MSRLLLACACLLVVACSDSPSSLPDGATPDAHVDAGSDADTSDAGDGDVLDASDDGEAPDGDLADGDLPDADVPDGDGPLTDLQVITDGVGQSGFVFRMGGPSNWGGMDVGTGGALPGAEITATSVDGTTTGGARRFVWTGTGQVYAQSEIGSATVDLSDYVTANAALVMRVRVDVAPDGLVAMLGTQCELPCAGNVAIGPTLAAIDDGEWHDVTVPLACLVSAGLDATRVNTPWLIYTESALTLSVEDVRWVPNAASSTPDCSAFMP